MIAAMVEKQIVATEAATGESADFMRDIFRVSPTAFWKFGMFMPLAKHRRAASSEARAVAALVGTLSEDCGPCVQTVVNLAQQDGVDGSVLRAVLNDKPEDLGPELAEVYDFAQAVVTAAPDAAARSDKLKQSMGEEAVVDLSLAIATTRVFPTVKRGLGYGVSCSLVQVEV